MSKKCFITYRFKTGGVEKLFLTLSEALREDLCLLILHSDYDESIQEIPPQVSVLSLPGIVGKIKWKPARYIFFLLTFYIRFRCQKRFKDLVFINFSDTLSTLLATWFFSFGNKKYSWIQVNPRVVAQSKFYRIYSFLYTRMDKVICICYSQKQLLLSLFPALADHKIEVIPNCINLSKINREKVAPFRYMYKKYILMVARLDMRSKDFYTLIDAYNQLRPGVKKDYELLLLGEGPDRPFIEKYIKSKGLEENIKLPGQDPNPYKWMYRASLYVHSSRAEGFGLVLLEALQCGVPIIATDCETGPREILQNGKYGKILPVGDSDALCRAIMDSLKEDKNMFSAARGMHRAKKYDVAHAVNKLLKIIG